MATHTKTILQNCFSMCGHFETCMKGLRCVVTSISGLKKSWRRFCCIKPDTITGLKITGSHHYGGETFLSIFSRSDWKCSEKSLLHSDDLSVILSPAIKMTPRPLWLKKKYSIQALEIILKNALPQVMSDRYFKACDTV